MGEIMITHKVLRSQRPVCGTVDRRIDTPGLKFEIEKLPSWQSGTCDFNVYAKRLITTQQLPHLLAEAPNLATLFLAIDRITGIYIQIMKIETNGGTRDQLYSLLSELTDLLQLFTSNFYPLANGSIILQRHLPAIGTDLGLVSSTVSHCANTLQDDSDIRKVAMFVNQRLGRLVSKINKIKSVKA